MTPRHEQYCPIWNNMVLTPGYARRVTARSEIVSPNSDDDVVRVVLASVIFVVTVGTDDFSRNLFNGEE